MPKPLAEPIPAALQQAHCQQTGPDLFFADDRTSRSRAKRVCRRCPVQTACLDWALATREPFGVWGGLDEDERRALLVVPAPGPAGADREAVAQ